MNFSELFYQLERTGLPIVEKFDEIISKFKTHPNMVLQAEPGAGKTTLLPLLLLDLIPQDKKILLLEPRRLAVKNAALRMSKIIGESVGSSVGFRIRDEVKVHSKTRIEVITEGILTRMLQTDPELSDVALIIFDEFHERNLDADLGLAFALEVQQTLRDDLKILVMSATLDINTILTILPNSSSVYSEGRTFPVTIEYCAPKKQQSWLSILTATINKALTSSTHDILVFLPGKYEINKADLAIRQLLQELGFDAEVKVMMLYGALDFEQQQLVLKPLANLKKIILATNIAESSITIDGVNCVIDSGLMRHSHFDPNIGFDRLQTVKISTASATQRCGRAGRLAPGICYRLWPESESLRVENKPEILRADLTQFALELAQWGVSNISDLGLLDFPSSGVIQQANSFLLNIQALHSNLQITEYGKQILQLGIHPRFAHMILQSIRLDVLDLACLVAAALEERDVFQGSQAEEIDFSYRIEALVYKQLNSAISRRIFFQQNKLRVKVGSIHNIKPSKSGLKQSLSILPVLVAMVFPDRIAQKRGSGYRLANGSGVALDPHKHIASDYIVVVKSGGSESTAKLFQAISLSLGDLKHYFSSLLVELESIFWDPKSQSVRAEKHLKFGELILQTSVINLTDKLLIGKALIQGIKDVGISQLPWSESLKQWQARINRLREIQQFAEEYPDVSDETLSNTLDTWLTSFIQGKSKISQISTDNLSNALHNLLSWELQSKLDRIMPTHIEVATGSKISVDYRSNQKPVMAVKLQEMFGQEKSPLVAEGRISVLIHLLSPAKRPLQITEDLASFWKDGYLLVKKEMRGKYPKHPWPDNPLEETATRHVKRRRK